MFQLTKMSLLFVVFSFFFHQPCVAADVSMAKPYPIIMLGGRWTGISNTEGYSKIARVCETGVTHVFSYYTESLLSSNVDLPHALNNALEFSTTVKDNCPNMRVVMGVPRRWIYDGRLDLIRNYVLGLKERNISFDYWFTDEVIYEMVVKQGLAISDAVKRAKNAVDTIKSVSTIPIIWNEPGNYNSVLSLILDELNHLPVDIKAYDEYIISKTGRLSNSQSKVGYYALLETLRRLEKNNGIVFPVCEIDNRKNAAPTNEELAVLSISLLMNGANGIVYWEERWASDDTIRAIESISGVMNILNNFGISKFRKTTETGASWEGRNANDVMKVIVNTTSSSIPLESGLPNRAEIIWPVHKVSKELKPMELLVYRFKSRDK